MQIYPAICFIQMTRHIQKIPHSICRGDLSTVEEFFLVAFWIFECCRWDKRICLHMSSQNDLINAKNETVLGSSEVDPSRRPLSAVANQRVTRKREFSLEKFEN